jgi:hypothetical protein
VATEEGIGNVISYGFDDESVARRGMGEIWTARVLFNMTGQEVESRGINPWAINTIRRIILKKRGRRLTTSSSSSTAAALAAAAAGATAAAAAAAAAATATATAGDESSVLGSLPLPTNEHTDQ